MSMLAGSLRPFRAQQHPARAGRGPDFGVASLRSAPQSAFPSVRGLIVRAGAESSSDEASPLKISVPKSRKSSAPPPTVSILHSSTYTLEEDLGSIDEGVVSRSKERAAVRVREARSTSSKDYDNPVEYMLQRADESLAKAEEKPPEAAKVFWDVARGPVGQTASRGLRGVMEVSVEVGKGAVTAAAPVAKWAAKKGAQAMFSAVSKGVQSVGGDKPKPQKDNASKDSE